VGVVFSRTSVFVSRRQ